jgi:hypothetical protein
MTEPKPIFVVWGTRGEWSDTSFKVFCATDDRDEADEFVRKGNEEGDRKAAAEGEKHGKELEGCYRNDHWTYRVQVVYGPNHPRPAVK